jgi:hypothetical protein
MNGTHKNDNHEATIDKKKHQIVGYFGQLRILTWKNLILSKRNLCGLLSEILLPIILVAFLILIRYFVDVVRNNDQITPTSNVIDLIPFRNQSRLLLYYPDNAFIEGIVSGAAALINLRKPLFNITGKEIVNFSIIYTNS